MYKPIQLYVLCVSQLTKTLLNAIPSSKPFYSIDLSQTYSFISQIHLINNVQPLWFKMVIQC